MFNVNKITDLQADFLARLYDSNLPKSSHQPNLLSKIIACDKKILETNLGPISSKILNFIQNIDLDHPDIHLILNRLIASDQEFSEFVQFLQNNDPKNKISVEPFNNTSSFSEKIKILENNTNARFLKNEKDREEIRLSKKIQTIDLQYAYKKGLEFWDAQPNNFKRFLRFDSSYAENLTQAEAKAKRYEELGCLSLANEIKKNIESLKKTFELSYYGFNQINLISVAIVLAKVLNYSFECSQVYQNKGWNSNWVTEVKISVKQQFFEDFNFNPFDDLVDKKKSTKFDYEPRVYPLHELKSICTENVNKIISALDNFPEAGNKPIFDNYGVVVPGINFPAKKNDRFTILDKQGIIRSYNSKKEATKCLDKIFIENNYFYPVLVGEKDSKCYFICYWS